MKKYIIQASVLALSAMALTGCDDFLDTMPDNRATLNNEEKITKMLVRDRKSTRLNSSH